MNTDNLFQFVQQGFRVTIGAAATLLETLQDPQKRDMTFSDLQTEWQQRSEEWAAKGETTEQEARRTLDELWQRQTGSAGPSPFDINRNRETETNTVTTENRPETQSEIQSLTEQIVTLRHELEQLRQTKD